MFRKTKEIAKNFAEWKTFLRLIFDQYYTVRGTRLLSSPSDYASAQVTFFSGFVRLRAILELNVTADVGLTPKQRDYGFW